jgi:hypothetical protein
MVASRSGDTLRRTPLRHRIYLSGKTITEDCRRESGKFVIDLRQEKGKRGSSPSIWSEGRSWRGSQSIYELRWEKWGWSTVKRRK